MRAAAILTIVLAFLLLAAPVSQAEDRVVLRSGAVLAGKILKDTDEGVVIEIPGLGKITVPRSQIGSVEGGPRPTPKPEPVPKVVQPAPERVPVENPIEVLYDEVQPGEKLLVIENGEHHGTYATSGRRFLAEIPVRSGKRMKVVFDPEAGVQGFTWLPRDRVRRLIRVEGYPERLILFFEGVETGSWIEGATAEGKTFAGQLSGVSDTGVISIWVPGVGTVENENYPLDEVRLLTAISPTRELESILKSLAPGEPVGFRIRGRMDVSGRLISADRAWFVLEVAGELRDEVRKVQLFRGLPILDAMVLPEEYRAEFRGLAAGDHLTVVSVKEDETSVIRRSVTGSLSRVTLSQITLVTREGPVELPMDSVLSVERPDPKDVPLLTEGKSESEADSAVPILPGMSQEEAEKTLTEEYPGLDFLADDGKVARVFCRPPFAGPVFGIRLGSEFTEALAETDLLFDTQIDPKGGEEPRVITMISNTLSRYVVKLYVATTGEVLAAEITGK